MCRFLQQPGSPRGIRGFAPPPRDGFALVTGFHPIFDHLKTWIK